MVVVLVATLLAAESTNNCEIKMQNESILCIPAQYLGGQQQGRLQKRSSSIQNATVVVPNVMNGCEPFQIPFGDGNQDIGNQEPNSNQGDPLAVVVLRGSCAFDIKVQNSQQSSELVAAVIIVDSPTDHTTPGQSLQPPGFFNS